jgi:ribose-phosphate pyrophosphokinase
MVYLNLGGFNPYSALEEECIAFKSFIFPGGEPHIQIDSTLIAEDIEADIQVSTRINNSNDFMTLLMALAALKNIHHNGSTYLFIPYFPGARQDIERLGEPLTVQVYADILNNLFSEVQVQCFDPHSDAVALSLDSGDFPITNHEFVKKAIKDIAKEHHLISPDAGSNKKMAGLCKYLNVNKIVKCDKTRDFRTGVLSGFEVYATDLKGKDCIIVDDICDGGGTFIGLAKELKKKNAGDLYLIVSHGIFSQGFEELEKHFKCIYYTDSIGDLKSTYSDFFINTDKLKQIKIQDLELYA